MFRTRWSSVVPLALRRLRTRIGRHRLSLERLEDRTLPSGFSLTTAIPIVLHPQHTTATSGTFTAGSTSFFTFQVTRPGRLQASLQASGGAARLAMYDDQQQLLIDSDGQTPGQSDDLIDQHLEGAAAGTTYSLEVQGLSGGGTFTLTNEYTPSFSPFQPFHTGAQPAAMVTGDFNGDGIPDLATADQKAGDVRVFLGLGDGTFRSGSTIVVDGSPVALVAGDFNGDGCLDLATANVDSGTMSVLFGRGNGTFQAPETISVGPAPSALAVGDFNGDGRLDLAVANRTAGTVTAFLGQGQGTFEELHPVAAGAEPVALTTGDLNGDGVLDLVSVNQADGTLTLLWGNGNGTFQTSTLTVGSDPVAVAAADLNGDGHLDLAIAHRRSSIVQVLGGQGDGTFLNLGSYKVGANPVAVAATDVNGDGVIDLATANRGSGDVTVLQGRGNGTFQSVGSITVGPQPVALVLGDFNGSGQTDLAVADQRASTISIRLGLGDGSAFASTNSFATGATPVALATGDFNHDGRLDLATADRTAGTVTVLLGNGDGTYERFSSFAVGSHPVALVAADLNGDGNLDLAVANQNDDTVTVLLGLGNGAFQVMDPLSVGRAPTALAAADFDRDGHIDLAVVNRDDNTVQVLGGLGNGTFRSLATYPTGKEPVGLATTDLNRDNLLDLAIVNRGSNDISLLFGDGQGGFTPAPAPLHTGQGPTALAAVDLNGDGVPDLVTADSSSHTLTVRLGYGTGKFRRARTIPLPLAPTALAAGQFHGNRSTDLVALGTGSSGAALLHGLGNGQFQAPTVVSLPAGPTALLADDFNGDGSLDLAATTVLPHTTTGTVSVLLGDGDGTFVPAGSWGVVHATPLVGDLNGDGVPDVVVLTRAGDIRFRAGRPGANNIFAAPMPVNREPNPSHPMLAARDATLVKTATGLTIAALDARSPTVSLYTTAPLTSPDSPQTFTRVVGALPSGARATRIVAGDLEGNPGGLQDLVVADAATNSVLVYRPSLRGSFDFTAPLQVSVGIGPSDIILVDVNGDGRRDIIATNQVSGDVSILLNEGNGRFAPEERFRAGNGLFGLAPVGGSSAVQSALGTFAVVAGRFDEQDPIDLIVTNSLTNHFALLRGTPSGGFLNPIVLPSFVTGTLPTELVAADINRDHHLDLVVLSQRSNRAQVFLGDGAGNFSSAFQADTGKGASGLSVVDLNGDHVPELLLGNGQGDVLILKANSNGTLQPFERTERNTALAAADLDGDGQPDFIVVNQARDQVSIQYSTRPGASAPLATRANGLAAPSAVAVADLNRDGVPDLVLANSGGNNILVYLGLGGGLFGSPRTFPVGSTPAGITVTYLDDDLVTDPTTGKKIDPTPDLVVANEGSNDLSILLGQGQGTHWTLTAAPRVRTHRGPVATTVADLNGDGIPDLLVANSQSNDVSYLRGLGHGYFDDRRPRVLNVGTAPTALFLGNFTSGPGPALVTVNTASDDLTYLDQFPLGGRAVAATRPISSGGRHPIAALAGDFNGDGISDLLVVNQGTGTGDGNVTVFLGTPTGLDLRAVVPVPDIANLTALALATHVHGIIGLFVTGSGIEGIMEIMIPVDAGSTPVPAPAVPTSGTVHLAAAPALVEVPNTARPVLRTELPVGLSMPVENNSTTVAEHTGTVLSPPPLGPSASSGSGESRSVSYTTSPDSGVEVVTDSRPEAPSADAPARRDDPVPVAVDEPLSSVELAGSLLTGGPVVLHLAPQKGAAHAPVGGIVPGEEVPASVETPEEETLWPNFVIGLDDTIHRGRGLAAPSDLDLVHSSQLVAVDSAGSDPTTNPGRERGDRAPPHARSGLINRELPGFLVLALSAVVAALAFTFRNTKAISAQRTVVGGVAGALNCLSRIMFSPAALRSGAAAARSASE